MEKRKLGEFVSFVPGINPTRAEKQIKLQEIDFYDQSSFKEDFYCGNDLITSSRQCNTSSAFLNENDVIISNSLQLATIVSRKNAGKVLSLNFTKVEFLDEELDKCYFLYLFNSYSDMKKQKERSLQGSGSMQRISLKELKELIIPFIDIEEQKKIGNIYVETLKLQSRLNQYAQRTVQFTEAILEDNLRGVSKDV